MAARDENAESVPSRKRVSFDEPSAAEESSSSGLLRQSRPLPRATAPVRSPPHVACSPLEATLTFRPEEKASSHMYSDEVKAPYASPPLQKGVKPCEQASSIADIPAESRQQAAPPRIVGTTVPADRAQSAVSSSGNARELATRHAPVTATPPSVAAPPDRTPIFNRAPWNSEQDMSGSLPSRSTEQRVDSALSLQALQAQVHSSTGNPASALGGGMPLAGGTAYELASATERVAEAKAECDPHTAPHIQQEHGSLQSEPTDTRGSGSGHKPPPLSESILSEKTKTTALPLSFPAPRLVRTASASQTLPPIADHELTLQASVRCRKASPLDRCEDGSWHFCSPLAYTLFPSSAPPGPIEPATRLSPLPRALRSPYYLAEGPGCSESYSGAHRICAQGFPLRATPAIRKTSWSPGAWELACGARRTGGFRRERAWRLNSHVAAEEEALGTRPPPGTEQCLRVKAPKASGGGVVSACSASSPGVGKDIASDASRRRQPKLGVTSKRDESSSSSSNHGHEADVFLAAARDAIGELESALIGQDIRYQGEQMLKEGCIAYQDESIRLLQAHIEHLSQDLEACVQNQTFDRRESAMLLRHLRTLRRLRGTRQGNLVALHSLYRKLRAAREDSTSGQRTLLSSESSQAYYDAEETNRVTALSESPKPCVQELAIRPMHAATEVVPAACDASPRSPEVYVTSSLALPPAAGSSALFRFPSPDVVASATAPESIRLRQPRETLTAEVNSPAHREEEPLSSSPVISQVSAPQTRSSDQVPHKREQESQTTFSIADKGTVVSQLFTDSRPQQERVSDASKSITGPSPVSKAQQSVLVDAATGMSEVGFDELLGDREARSRREEEERLRTREEVLLIQQQREEVARQQTEEELVLRQQQEQLKLLQDQERLLRLRLSEQEKLDQVTKKLEVIEEQNRQLALQAHQAARREELKKLVQDATATYPFASGGKTGSPGTQSAVPATTLPFSPLPRTASPLTSSSPKGGAGVAQEREAMLRQREASPFLLLTSEETKAREDFRLANEQLQKRCAELHAQVTYLQMAGAGLSQEQVDFVEQQLAEQKAYNSALEKQNKELVVMAESALKEQEAGLAKEWGARLREVEAERDLARAAVKDGGQKSKLEVSALEQKFEAAERTKEDALARLVVMERAQEARDEEIAALRQRVAEMERTATEEKASLQRQLEELRASGGKERELMKSQYQQAMEESSQLKMRLEEVKQENERAKSLMRSRVASLAEQLERDQQEKDEVVNFVRLESQSIQAKLLSDAEAERKNLESRLQEQCRVNETLRGTAADLEKQVAQIEREKGALERELGRLRGEEAEKQANKEALLEEKDKRIEELEILSEALKKDLDASRMAANEVEGHFRAHRDAVAKKHVEEVERMIAEREKKEKELNDRLQAAQKMRDDLERKEREINDKLKAAQQQSGDREQKERELSDRLRASQVAAERDEKRQKELQEKLRAVEEEARRAKEGREQAEKEKVELEGKLQKLSEMSAKQHFERERMLQKHLQEKDVLRQSLARMVEESKELQSKYEGELKTRADSFQKEIEDREKQFSEELRHATESAEAAFSRQATLQENLTKVLKQHERDVENHKRALSHSELQRNMSIDGLKRRHREVVDALSRQAEQRICDVRDEYEKALAAQRDELQQANAELKKHYAELLKKGEDSLDELKKKHQAEIEELTRKQEDKLAESRRRSEAAVDELRRRNTADLEDAKHRLNRTTADFVASAQEQKEKAEKTTAELKRAHNEELQRLQRKFAAEMDDMKKALDRAKKAAAAERSPTTGSHAERFRRALQDTVASMQQELDTITRKLEELRTRNRSLERERAELLKAKKDLEDGVGTQAKDRAELQDTIERLQNRVEQLQGLLESKHKQIADLEKTLGEQVSQVGELKSSLQAEKALTAEKEDKLKRAAETIRVLKNQETKQRELAASLTNQLEAKERSYASLEAEMDNMQDKLRSKDRSDLEAQSHMRRRVMNLEHELDDQRRGNAELGRAKGQLEKENAQLKENSKLLQAQLRRLKESCERAASSNQESEGLRAGLQARVAELEQQVDELERRAEAHRRAEEDYRRAEEDRRRAEEDHKRTEEEHRRAEAKLRTEARRMGEEIGRKTSEVAKLKQELAATKERVAETNRRMRQSISDFAKEQEEIRARMARDFAQREEELLARCRRASEDRDFEAQARINELQALVDRLSAKASDIEKNLASSATPLHASSHVGPATDVSPFLRHAIEDLLQLAPFLGSGVEVGKVISEMRGMLPVNELTEALIRLAPWTSRSGLEDLLGKIVTSDEAAKLLDTQGEECCPRLSPEIRGLLAAVLKEFRNAKSRREVMDVDKVNELIDTGTSPLEVSDLLRTVGSALDGSQLVAVLGRILPLVPLQVVASVLANIFHGDAVAMVGEGLGTEFAEFLKAYVESEHFQPLLGLLREGIKELRVLRSRMASSSFPTGATPPPAFPPPAAVPSYSAAPGFMVPYPVYPVMPGQSVYQAPLSPSTEPVYRPSASSTTGLAYQQAPQQVGTADAATEGVVAGVVPPVSSAGPPSFGVPRLFNVSAKLSYKLLARKNAGQGGHRDDSRHSSPMQRVLSECSTN